MGDGVRHLRLCQGNVHSTSRFRAKDWQHTQAKPSVSSLPRSDSWCQYFSNGWCVRGSACWHSHESSSPEKLERAWKVSEIHSSSSTNLSTKFLFRLHPNQMK